MAKGTDGAVLKTATEVARRPHTGQTAEPGCVKESLQLYNQQHQYHTAPLRSLLPRAVRSSGHSRVCGVLLTIKCVEFVRSWAEVGHTRAFLAATCMQDTCLQRVLFTNWADC